MTAVGNCSSPSARVLIVEDVEALRMLLRLSLERQGASVKEAEGLSAARLLLRDGFRPDLVLLDLELGDGTGLDLIRELPTTASVHVLTADTTRETLLRCSNAGCASVFDKRQDLGGVVQAVYRGCAQPLVTKRIPADSANDRRYVEFLAESRVKLSGAFEAGEYGSLRQLAHRLRGTAVHFGYPGLSASAVALTKALKRQVDCDTERAVDSLIQQIGEALEAYRYHQLPSRQQE